MKGFLAAAFAAVAVADKKDFPRDDAFHAGCAVTATFAGAQCADIYAAIDSEVRAWGSAETSPAQGVYKLKEEVENDYVWSTRLTKNGKYVDDQLFDLTQTDAGCEVAGRSRSQSMSYYDYSVNFCNLWNVYNGIGGFTYETKKCGYPAKDPESTCAVY